MAHIFMVWILEDHERDAFATVSLDRFRRRVLDHVRGKVRLTTELSQEDYEKVAGMLFERVRGFLAPYEMATYDGHVMMLVYLGRGIVVGGLVKDYLDRPVTRSEADAIQAQAGDRSKAEGNRLRDCANDVWCQINNQTQGDFLPLRNRSDAQGSALSGAGPHRLFREGVIVAGLTHESANGGASRRNFRQIN